MNSLKVIFCAFFALCLQNSFAMETMNFENHRVMDLNEKYHLFWTADADKITMEIQVETLGYVAVGFSTNGAMAGADIFMAWINDDGEIVAHDRHATAESAPIIDEEQNYNLLDGMENGTHTTIRFSRAWDTCDDAADYLLSDDTVKVMWAYHPDDPTSNESPSYHGIENRGAVSIALDGIKETDFIPTADVKSTLFTSNNYKLSSDDTTYYCQIFKVPDDVHAEKHHIIAMEPVIQKGNEINVHHMLLYECKLPLDAPGTLEDMFEKYVGTGGDCYATVPEDFYECYTQAAFGWAVGSRGDILPDHIGVPISENYGGATYYMLETHYDNPTRRDDIIDNSGMQLHYTKNLRQYDSGLILFGSSVSFAHIIPPMQNRFRYTGRCMPGCTNEAIPESGLQVYSGELHTHLAGRDVKLQHMRNGVETQPLFHDKHYDFDYQAIRYLKEEFTILPGDTLMTECYYNTMDRNVATYGGFSTMEEMCLTFVRYYPLIPLSNCESDPTWETVLTALGIESIYGFKDSKPDLIRTKKNRNQRATIDNWFAALVVEAPENLQGMTVGEVIESFDWADENVVKQFEDALFYGEHDNFCFGATERLADSFVTAYPQFEAYVEPEREICNRSSSQVLVNIFLLVSSFIVKFL